MGNYEEALRALNTAQRKAVEIIDGPVLVIAGPGTGKTQLLTTRIAHILATTDTLPQNILCLTFTESAAQTMRARLGQMIGQAAYDVTIGTYHAFGSELIRNFPDYFAADSNLEPVDDLGLDHIIRTIIAGLPYSNPLKYSDAYIGDIKTLISDAKRALLTPDDLRHIAHQNLRFIERHSPVVGAALRGMLRIDKTALPRFAALLAEIRSLDARKEQAQDQDGTKAFLQELEQAVAAAEETGKTTALTAWKNAWLAKDGAGQFVVDGVKVNQKLLAAADVYEQYLAALKAQGLFDYDDMILRAIQALETNDDLRFTLQERYQYLLLDEFQDTNGAQLRLVELLTDNPVNEGRPNVLAVGDDDQAIYAFQGASYSHMRKFTHRYRDVVAVPLTENYRSHPDILNLARGVAEQIEERLHHHFPDIEKTLVARASNLPKQAIIERHEAQSDVMELQWVAKKIAECIAQGIPPEEIAVLAPQHKYLVPLVPFLQELDVPVRYEKRENILEEPAITQLLRMAELCQALAHGDHAAANALWAEVLSFDFWGLPTSLIWQLSWQANDDDHDWTAQLLNDNNLKPIALFFIRLSQLAASETLETMLDYLIGSQALELNEPGYDTYTSPYYGHYFGEITPDTNATFWDILTSLIVLRARLRDYRKQDEERFLLQDMLDFVAAHRAADLKILNTSPYASASSAVQLMTAFKAKGMEFKAVFVLAVNDEAWGSKARKQSSRISLPPNLQYIRYAGATNDERLRLFYVAITRAKTQLFLVNYTQTYTGKTMTHLKYLSETSEPNGTVLSPLLPAGLQAVLPIEDGLTQPTTELAAYWQQRHEAALSHSDVRTLLLSRLEHFQLSPTHLNDFIDVANCGPHAFFLRTIVRFPQASRPEVHFGNAMHETLEWLHHAAVRDKQVPAARETVKTFERQLRLKPLTDQQTEQFLERGASALEAYLAQRAATVTADNLVEYSFRGEGVFVGEAHLGGKIDKLLIDEQAKTITIVDYKTGRSHTRWTREVKLHKYRQQLYVYKLLVEGSHSFKNYTVADAYLEFVEPDEDGIIQELHVSFGDTETQHMRALVQAVWQHIMDLDLPDTSSYTPDLSGVEAFEADLIAENH